jgi:hypothetical protein
MSDRYRATLAEIAERNGNGPRVPGTPRPKIDIESAVGRADIRRAIGDGTANDYTNLAAALGCEPNHDAVVAELNHLDDLGGGSQ